MSDAKTGPTKDGKVNIRLAHPLNARDLLNLGLDPDKTPAGPGAIIEVTRDQGIGLASAGFVNVDTEDRAAMTALFDAAPEDVMPSATSGNKSLTGDDLAEALRIRGLPESGSADEKRAAVAAHDANA